MDLEGSVTRWIEQLKDGQRDAIQPVWERYFRKLVTLARKRLHGIRRIAADEEDVALSAFDSFCRAAEQGRFPQLEDREDLWRLLVVITERKALDLARDEHRLKRGGGKIVGESVFDTASSDESPGLAGLPGREPTPSFAALVAEECERLLGQLDNDGLRRVALLKMEGHSNEEIAATVGCALRTVERKLGLIRSTWQGELSA